jgi:hypothetical protein
MLVFVCCGPSGCIALRALRVVIKGTHTYISAQRADTHRKREREIYIYMYMEREGERDTHAHEQIVLAMECLQLRLECAI